MRLHFFILLLVLSFTQEPRTEDENNSLGLSQDELDLQNFASEDLPETEISENANGEKQTGHTTITHVAVFHQKIPADAQEQPATEEKSQPESAEEAPESPPEQGEPIVPEKGGNAGVVQPPQGPRLITVMTPAGPGECCNDATPQCAACRAGMPLFMFCKENPIVGCPTSESDKDASTNAASDTDSSQVPPPPKKCCDGLTPECLACQSGVSVDQYCKTNNIVGCPQFQSTEKPADAPGVCTIERAMENNSCPTARCATPEMVKKKCNGGDWRKVYEIEDVARCCLKPCNFRCLGKQTANAADKVDGITNTLAKPPPPSMPESKQMAEMDYDPKSNAVFAPAQETPTPKDEPSLEPAATEPPAPEGAKPDPTCNVNLDDKSISGGGFTFSYMIQNPRENGAFYWTVQRKDKGSMLASTVEKDGKGAPCSGSGVQSQTPSQSINVDCPLAFGQQYLLWFALDDDQNGSGVFLSPGEPIVINPPKGASKAPQIATTMMSTYEYAKELNKNPNEKPLKTTTEPLPVPTDAAEPEDDEDDEDDEDLPVTTMKVKLSKTAKKKVAAKVEKKMLDDTKKEAKKTEAQAKAAVKTAKAAIKKAEKNIETIEDSEDDDEDDESKEMKEAAKSALKKTVKKAEQTLEAAREARDAAEETKADAKEKIAKNEEKKEDLKAGELKEVIKKKSMNTLKKMIKDAKKDAKKS